MIPAASNCEAPFQHYWLCPPGDGIEFVESVETNNVQYLHSSLRKTPDHHTLLHTPILERFSLLVVS